MIKIWRSIILVACVTGLVSMLARGIGRAQSAALPVRHHPIQLTSQKISMPFGNKTFAGVSKEAKIANEHCLLCHSAGMIDTQPPLSLETWKKEVVKMRIAYGCPLRDDQTDRIAEFIAHAASAPAAGGD
jgi:hypothetical protein